MADMAYLNAEELAAMRQGDETVVISLAHKELEVELAKHPEFAAQVEDVDPDVCARAELVDLIRNAPTPILRQMLLSKYDFRTGLVMITGRSFF